MGNLNLEVLRPARPSLIVESLSTITCRLFSSWETFQELHIEINASGPGAHTRHRRLTLPKFSTASCKAEGGAELWGSPRWGCYHNVLPRLEALGERSGEKPSKARPFLLTHRGESWPGREQQGESLLPYFPFSTSPAWASRILPLSPGYLWVTWGLGLKIRFSTQPWRFFSFKRSEVGARILHFNKSP